MTAHDGVTQFTVDLQVTIRPVRQDDLPKLEWYGEFAHFRNLFQRSYREQQVGRRHMLVAACNDFPIGRLFIQLHSKNPLIANGHSRGYLYSFHVMEMFRGQGIGSRLIDEAEILLLNLGFQFVTIAVATENAGALRLYQRRGYQIFGEDGGRWQYLDHQGHIREINEPCWLLEKNLFLD